MPIYISLLRGINVGGHRKILMADLKALYQSLGFAHVTSYVQSGNVVFGSDEANANTIAAQLEAAIEQMTGFDVAVLVRTPAELEQVLAYNPYPNGAPNLVHVLFLQKAAAETAVSTFTPPPNNSDAFIIGDREIYIHYPNGAGQSKLSGNYFERKLGVVGTARNWRTVTKLVELAALLPQ